MVDGPDEWPILNPAAEWLAADPDDRDRASALAVHSLWALTGRVFGLTQQTVRPCFGPRETSTYSGRSGSGMDGYWWPGLISGSWMQGACGCASGCNCAGPSEVALPGPVAEIVSVLVDGETVPDSAYKVRNHRWLLRTDGDVWPQSQDLKAADDAAGAFTVTYKQGIPVPSAGQYAAGDLALDFLRAAKRSGACKIPDRAINVARQGITVELQDAAGLFEAGLTGISSVDQWIATVNPYQQKQPARVYSPDAPRAARFS